MSDIPFTTALVPPTLPLTAQRTIRRALHLLEKHLHQPGVAFLAATETRDWLRLKMAGLEREVFMVLFLDNQHRLLGHETLFTGTISHTEVHPREIIKATLRHNAAAVIFAHNHPSGEAEPSKADRLITRSLASALLLVEVRTLDHFVVGQREVVSFAERGWI